MVNRTTQMQQNVLKVTSGINKSIANLNTLENNLQGQRAALIAKSQSYQTAAYANATSKIETVSALLLKTLAALVALAGQSQGALNAVSSATAVVSSSSILSFVRADYLNAIAYGISSVNTTCYKLSNSYTVSFNVSHLNTSSNFNGTANNTGRRLLSASGGRGGSSGSTLGFSLSR